MRHAGRTQGFPKGVAPHAVLKTAARLQFASYAAQRPQLAFDEPEITIHEDLTHSQECGMWDVQSEVAWP